MVCLSLRSATFGQDNIHVESNGRNRSTATVGLVWWLVAVVLLLEEEAVVELRGRRIILVEVAQLSLSSSWVVVLEAADELRFRGEAQIQVFHPSLPCWCCRSCCRRWLASLACRFVVSWLI